jgi:hypothetical protein
MRGSHQVMEPIRSLPLKQLEGVPRPVVVLLEALLEKDPGRRFQNPAELLKAIPTITGRIEAAAESLARACVRCRLQPRAPRHPNRRQDRDPRKFQSRGCPKLEVMFSGERRTSHFWIAPGHIRTSTSLLLLPGPASGSPRSLTIGSGGWPLNGTVARK